MYDEKEILQHLGLEEKEAALYLSALNSGEARMAELAKKSSLKRSSAYLIFKTLEQKGLMGSFRTRQGLRFVATLPEILKERTKKQLEDLDRIMPQLKAMAKSPDRPKVTYYEGKEGYLTAIENSLRVPNITLRHIGSLTELHKIIGENLDLKYYLPKRVAKNILLRALYFKEDAQKLAHRDSTKELREIRILPDKYRHKTSSLIYGDRVIMVSAKEELAVMVIESAEISLSESAKFDLIWDLVSARPPTP
ncbi:MAG: helix-turn-helix domain-containing protein [Patescibacteria group bacterium]